MTRRRRGPSPAVVIVLLLLLALAAGLHASHRLPRWSAAAAAPADPRLAPLGLPVAHRPLEILAKAHFTVAYDDDAKQPAWACYQLAGPITERGQEHRPPKFADDPAVANAAHHDDYDRSGYDRGHLVPAYAEWSRFGQDGLEATFVTSNICPQVHALNAGLWEDLEAAIAGRAGEDDGWAAAYGNVWITDGPVFAAHPDHLPAGEAIPTAFFMIVLRSAPAGSTPAWDALAVEMPNRDDRGRPDDYLVPIRRLQADTGLDFFPDLPVAARDALLDAKPAALWPHADFTSHLRH
jgi:endonuclease G